MGTGRSRRERVQGNTELGEGALDTIATSLVEAADADRSFIRVRSARKIYATGNKSVEALSDVSFDVARGEFVAILGPSGCGKSTLLMMCGGLEKSTSGVIEVAGSPMAGPRTSIGIMFQDPTLLPWKT